MWIQYILTLLFPPRCVSCKKEGSLLCHTCALGLPNNPLRITNTTWALMPYQHPIGGKLIHAMKFEGKKNLADIAGKSLAGAVERILGADKSTVILVPIPTSLLERKRRGYDHVRLMTESLARHTSIETFPLLTKIRETERQVTMKTREKRLSNLHQAFHYDERYDVTGKTIILIDDVTTTGATFTEAQRALKHTPAERVLCLALAH